MLPVYILTGGEVFYDITNAIAAFFGSSSWAMIIRWSLNVAVITGIVKFIGTKDLIKLIRWVFLYIFILSVLVVPKESVQIIDLSDHTSHYKVDNVPVGVAILFSFSTRIGFGLAEVYDDFFSAPDPVTYSKTGFLFGANLIRDSLNSNIDGSELKMNVNNYVTNCVVGDIMLNHKYSLQDLAESTDVFELITNDPSPIRRTIYSKNNISCREASVQMKSDFNEMFRKQNSIFSLLNPNFSNSKIKEAALRNLLSESYSFFYNTSKSAVDILKTNITNNAIRHGINSFAGKQDDISGLIMTTSENAQLKARLNWGVSTKIATTYLPMLHTVMILLLFGLFPIIILLTVSDTMGVMPLKLYALSMVYLMSWLPLYSILNYVMVHYTKSSLQNIAPTLDNSNKTKIILSDISMIAGYLSLSIPFLAMGIVKGFSAVATNASSFLTSTLSGAASQVSSSAMDGNWSLGNVSTENVQGFKWDTNYNYASGNITQQLSNGAVKTTSADGTMGINTSAIQSHLATSGTISKSVSQQYLQAARYANSIATEAQEGVNYHSRNLYNNLTQFQNALNKGKAFNKNYNSDELTNLKQTVDDTLSTIEQYANRNNIHRSKAANYLNYLASSGQLNLDGALGIKAGASKGMSKKGKGSAEVGGELSGKVGGGFNFTTGSTDNINDNLVNSNDNSKNDSSDLVQKYQKNMDILKSFKFSFNGNESDNYNQAYIDNINSSFENAVASTKLYNDSKSVAYSLTQESNQITSGNSTITTNLNNEFVKWLKTNDPLNADAILSNTSDSRLSSLQEQLWNQFITQHANQRIHDIMAPLPSDLRNKYLANSEKIKNDTGLDAINNQMTNNVSDAIFENNLSITNGKANVDANVHGLSKDVGNNLNENNTEIKQKETNLNDKHNTKRDQYNINRNEAIGVIKKSQNDQSFVDDNPVDDSNKGTLEKR